MARILVVFAALAALCSAQDAFLHRFLQPQSLGSAEETNCEQCKKFDEVLKVDNADLTLIADALCTVSTYRIMTEECRSYVAPIFYSVCGENCTENLVKIAMDLKKAYLNKGRDIEKACNARGYCSSDEKSTGAKVENITSSPANEDDCHACLTAVQFIDFESSYLPEAGASLCTTINSQPGMCEIMMPPMLASLCETNCSSNFGKIMKDLKESYDKEGKNISKVCMDRGHCPYTGKNAVNVSSKVSAQQQQSVLASTAERRTTCAGCLMMTYVDFLDSQKLTLQFSLSFCESYIGQSDEECAANVLPFFKSACYQNNCVVNVAKVVNDFSKAQSIVQVCTDRGYCSKEKVEDCRACRDLNDTLHKNVDDIKEISATNCYEIASQTPEQCKENWPSFINSVCDQPKDNCTEILVKIYTDLKADFEKYGSDIDKFCEDKKFCASKSGSMFLFVMLPIVVVVLILAVGTLGVFLYRKKRYPNTPYSEF